MCIYKALSISNPWNQIMRIDKYFISCIFIFLATISLAQNNKAIVYGRITDLNNNPVELANITINNGRQGSISNASGYYELEIPANKVVELIEPKEILKTFKDAYNRNGSTVVVEQGDFYSEK